MLNWSNTIIPLYDFGSDQAVDNATTTGTWYGDECGYKRRVLGAKFFGETAITGNTAAKFDIAIWSGTTKIAELTFNTGTDHTANDFTDLTLETRNSDDTNHIIAADTTLTCSVTATGSPTMLHTNSKVVVTWAPAEIY